MQWRWDHDRAALLEELAAEKAENEAKRLADFAAMKAARLKVTLPELRKRRFFAEWKDSTSPTQLRQSRKIITDTIDALIALGPEASEASKMSELERCVVAFNDLDEKSQFIDTTEREDLCEVIDAIAIAGGLRYAKDIADAWRDW